VERRADRDPHPRESRRASARARSTATSATHTGAGPASSSNASRSQDRGARREHRHARGDRRAGVAAREQDLGRRHRRAPQREPAAPARGHGWARAATKNTIARPGACEPRDAAWISASVSRRSRHARDGGERRAHAALRGDLGVERHREISGGPNARTASASPRSAEASSRCARHSAKRRRARARQRSRQLAHVSVVVTSQHPVDRGGEGAPLAFGRCVSQRPAGVSRYAAGAAVLDLHELSISRRAQRWSAG
jgi:hypothetical protein